VLQLAGQDQDGAWLVVAAIENADDSYLVVGADGSTTKLPM
jgi:hypothetical protein